ncbi:hypothetical protein GCK72_010307 [Caenorhabditis remanei]|uniref:ABC transporter domain-containing protein n=1 Tax=Caenorhabditis remanei TaxID=31234 RepID=A0A6A5H4U8_CAERE|nr:hypothetical protein GCK72_010307 [Caenorhabditis remanei]KAF1762045.1 hypothetical protein GCK72_010307 [Caenorhabditis remanei]
MESSKNETTKTLLSARETENNDIEVGKWDNLVTLQWKNLKVTTKAGRVLLNGVSGCAVPGEVIALMGASGAGKTTLLNTLLQRNLKGLDVEGEILVNGQNIGKGVTSVSAYVQQEDLFMGTLTVKEHLEIQAKLRLPPGTSKSERAKRVEEVMNEMLLEKPKNSRIGIPGIKKGISGGEMKRLAFATEMINNPPIIFCDEPTTGLDSHMSLQVVKTLEAMALEKGKTIICTIHQPSSEVFEIFDKVVFLAQGRIAFHGAIDEAIHHFSACGYQVPDHTNPADYFIDTLAIKPSEAETCKQRCQELCDKFEKSVYHERLLKLMDQTKDVRAMTPHHSASYFVLLMALFNRYMLDNIRNPAIMKAKMIQKLFMGLFIGLLFYGLEVDQDGLTGYKGALFYYISELTYSTIFGIQAFMPADYPPLVREYDDRIYPISAYYIAKILSFLPIFTVDGIVLVLSSYFFVGFPINVVTFLRQMITCMIIEWNVAALGIAVCATAPSYAIAVTVTGPLLTVFSLTGGLFTNVSEMHVWISWVQYLSWFRYGYESLVVNQFEHEKFDNITCQALDRHGQKQLIPDSLCEESGRTVVNNFSFESANLYTNWIAMIYLTIVIYIIGYVGLVRRVIANR